MTILRMTDLDLKGKRVLIREDLNVPIERTGGGARITSSQRIDAALPDADTQANLRQGFLPIGDDQILRLDNDRNFPENGVLTLQPKGVHA